ncbi:hypothetical protein ARMGADRAFT_1028386 [Armillaria gallica]|uniref:Uncharacterized protein n=1 Tax=Armillaria gallica TaxID=47427 RepID=A0A2H3DQP9_ARMGA|nr:hypothetical protein ARMGADRAFT_1028386 [Armillaria gallica]
MLTHSFWAVKIWFTAFWHSVTPVSITTSPDPGLATVDPSASSPASSVISIVMENTYLSHSDGFHEEDRAILVSRLKGRGQKIRLGECVKSDKISGIARITHLGHIHGRYIFLDASFLEFPDAAVVVLCAHICDVDLSLH